MTPSDATIESHKREIVAEILESGALSLRDVAAGEEPFLYSSGNRGPGYFMIKGLVSRRELLKHMAAMLASSVAKWAPNIEYVSGNATGGMVPAWVMAEALSVQFGRDIPYFYVRNTRKIGGHGEYITGDQQNAFFKPGRVGLVMEELVNFAETTVNSALVQRQAGYIVPYAATFVSYDHMKARHRLSDNGVRLYALFTVHELLDIAESIGHPAHLISDYRAFLNDPKGWQERHGIEPATA